MKKIIVLLISILAVLGLSTQVSRGISAAKTTGHVFGKIVDSTSKPLADASVMILENKKDPTTGRTRYVLLQGMTSSVGAFSFEDASGGGAGILNIILKKNKKKGYKGRVRAGINKYSALEGGVDFNVRQNKINFSGGINPRLAKGKSTAIIGRSNISQVPVTNIL